MATVQLTRRFYVFIAIAGAIITYLYLQGPDVSTQSKEYVDSLFKTTQSWQTYADSANTAPVSDNAGVPPPPPPVFPPADPPIEFGTPPPAHEPANLENHKSNFPDTPADTNPPQAAEPLPPAKEPLPGDVTAPLIVDPPITTPTAEDDGGGWGTEKEFFEYEQPYEMPKIDVETLKRRPPHNYLGAGHPTYGMFFMSRTSSLQDPYFLATHQIIYRLLWNEGTKSEKHPVVVFVPPFVTQEQRDWFQAAGAMVREVEARPFHPDEKEVGGVVPHRFRDVFAKLEMWRHTEFSRVLFLDSDAFPLVNPDVLLTKEMSPDQQCKISQMFEDHPFVGSDSSVCQYVFSGVRDLVYHGMTNVGVLVFKPSMGMHELLVRKYQNHSLFHDAMVEQAFLSYVFRDDGPFPPTNFDIAWNGDPGVKDKGGDLFILHAKLWVVMFEGEHWAQRIFADTWTNLTTFYESEEFQRQRKADGPAFGLEPSK